MEFIIKHPMIATVNWNFNRVRNPIPRCWQYHFIGQTRPSPPPVVPNRTKKFVFKASLYWSKIRGRIIKFKGWFIKFNSRFVPFKGRFLWVDLLDIISEDSLNLLLKKKFPRIHKLLCWKQGGPVVSFFQ